MKISERIKKDYQDMECKILYRGDGTVILEVKKGEKGIKKALTADEMKMFYALMRISEDSANDYLYVKLIEAVKELKDENET